MLPSVWFHCRIGFVVVVVVVVFVVVVGGGGGGGGSSSGGVAVAVAVYTYLEELFSHGYESRYIDR